MSQHHSKIITIAHSLLCSLMIKAPLFESMLGRTNRRNWCNNNLLLLQKINLKR